MFQRAAGPLALFLASALGAQTAAPAKSALVILSGTDCTLSVDGEKAADIRADEPVRLEVVPGDYVISAVASDGRKWSRVLRVEGFKTIVQVDFSTSTGAAPSPSVSPPTSLAPAAPPAPVAPATPAAQSLASPSPSWIPIPAGEFEMGCSQGDEECNPAEMPLRHVRVDKPFEMMEKPVTVAQFRDWASASVQRRLPSQPKWSADDVPAVNVTWDEAAAFCSALVARLPTELEWEYSARGGSSAPRYGELDSIAWYAGNSDKRAHPVGQKAPNAFGLYDMLGNVWEWNADVFRPLPSKGSGVQAGPHDARSLRGGSWRNKAKQIRVSNRGRLAPDDREDDDGFRCARDSTPR